MLLAAPHRLAFFAGASMLAVSACWWLATLAAGYVVDAPVVRAIAPGNAHALLMGCSFMPMFFAGFVCTAAPRWLSLPAVEARSLLAIVAGWLMGWTAFVVGAHLSAIVAAAGLAIVAWSWSVFCLRFLRMLGASRAADRSHLIVIATACAIGAATLWLATIATASTPDAMHRLVPPMLWWFLAPVFGAAVHRMVPFFGTVGETLDQRHPNWLLHAWLLVFAVQPPLAWAYAHVPAFTLVATLFDALVAVFLLGLSARWWNRHRPGTPLLRMLFAGFAWLGIAFVLQAAHAASLWAESPAPDLQRASVHALSMGFFGSTMLAMVSRITCGQSGRLLSAERPVWLLFLVLQAATALRIGSVFVPAWPSVLLAAAFAWAFVACAWSLRYIGWYGRPRPDGRPG